MEVDGANNDWSLIISLLERGDTNTPSVTLGFYNIKKITEYGMVSLPAGSYRVVFMSYGNRYISVTLRNVDVVEGACFGEGMCTRSPFYYHGLT